MEKNHEKIGGLGKIPWGKSTDLGVAFFPEILYSGNL